MEIRFNMNDGESHEFIEALARQVTSNTKNQFLTEGLFNKEELEGILIKSFGKALRNLMRDHFEGKLFTLTEKLCPEELIKLLETKPEDYKK